MQMYNEDLLHRVSILATKAPSYGVIASRKEPEIRFQQPRPYSPATQQVPRNEFDIRRKCNFCLI